MTPAARLSIALAVAVTTAAALLRTRERGSDLPIAVWLAALIVVGALGVWLASRGGADDVRRDRVWPEWTALALGLALGFARMDGPLSHLPELFNVDGEAASLVYIVSVAVLFFALRKLVLSHRAGSYKAAAHGLTCAASGLLALVVAAAILFAE